MTDLVHRVGRRACAWVVMAMTMGSAALAQAQTASAPSGGRGPITFMPRGDFHMSAEHVSSDDERFVWEANFGGDVDLVDYGWGRATFVANYQVLLGNEFRRFDPNQGNYTLEGSSSARLAGVEVAAVFHHISRHLSDRSKRFPIDWNMLGGRVQKQMTSGRVSTNARVDLRGTIKKSFVDYRWEVDAEVRNRYQLRPAVALISAVDLRHVGVDGSRVRGRQTGFRGEGGVRLEGRGGAAELFVAVERRIDPYQFEFATDTWFSTGFRFVSK